MISARRTIKNCRGQSLVEFALIVPVLLALLLGIIEWGFVLWTQSSFANATRDGARMAVVIPDWNVNQSVRMEEVKEIVESRLSSLPDSLKEDILDNIIVQLLPDAENPVSIRVSIQDQPYSPVVGLGLIPVPGALSASAEFRLEGSL